MAPTESQLKRTQSDWTSIAREPVKVEFSKGTMYGYGSELAVLRLFYSYRNHKDARAKYSKNLNTWFFAIDTNL